MRYRLLILGFLFSIGLISVSGFYALNATRQVLISTQEGEEHFKVITTAAAEVSSYAKRAEGHLFLYLALHRKKDGEKFPKRIKSLYEQISVLDKNIKNLDARIILEKIKENTAETLPNGNKLIAYHDKAMETIGKFVLEKHHEVIFELHNKFAAIRRLGVSLVALEVKLENDLKTETLKNAKRLQSYMIILIAVTTIFALLLGYLLIKIVRSLNEEIAKRLQSEKDISNERNKLKDALKKVKTLSGLLPICASCKKIRDDKGYWNQIESYIQQHSEAEFSHGLCPECMKKLYSEFSEEVE
jgi:hypothetical protein